MATITRDNLFDAIETAAPEYVSRKARRKLIHWAHDAESFNIGDWDNCPLDQVGLVKEFETRGNYSPSEDLRFADEATELDARIIDRLDPNNLYGEVSKLAVYVRD